MKKSLMRAVSFVLLVMTVVSLLPTAALADNYKAYTGNSVSIVDALYAVGASDKETKLAYRKLIAAANETQKDENGNEVLKNYRGTAEQNTFMLKLLKEGKLVKPATPATPSTPSTPSTPNGYFPKYTGKVVGFVQSLSAVGCKDISFGYRAKIALANGIVDKIEDYKGTFTQNNDMIILLQKGELKKPA